jgi:hypothetical protein
VCTGIVICLIFVKNHDKQSLLSALRFLFETDISKNEVVMGGEKNRAFEKD